MAAKPEAPRLRPRWSSAVTNRWKEDLSPILPQETCEEFED